MKSPRKPRMLAAMATLEILGCDGSKAPDTFTTSLLVDEMVLIDAGCVMSKLTHAQATQITDLFLTHAHLDHVGELPYLIDTRAYQGTAPLRIHGLPHTLDAIVEGLFNWKIWPDFRELPDADHPQFTLHPLESDTSVEANAVKITPFPVHHSIPCVGYKIESETGSLIFGADTGPTDALWEVANASENLKALIVEVSFPARLREIALASKHLSTDLLAEELQKLARSVPLYATHIKAGLLEEIRHELAGVSHNGRPIELLREAGPISF